jgi:O-antigen ligase
MLWAAPFMVFTLIVSYRRTFFVAILASTFVMFLTIGKGRRMKQLFLLLGMLVAFAIFILFTDPIGFLSRLAGIVQPGEEGSAYIRLMELPNVLMNIRDNPIFGTPIGTLWHEYYRMPVFANYTRVGVHNTYLYWPLRTGIPGTIGFIWLLVRMWKATLINFRLAKTEEDYFVSQISVHLLVIYQVACFFGLMYGDAVTTLVAMILVAFQLQMRGLTGLTSYKNVDLRATWKAREIVLKKIPQVLPAAHQMEPARA